MPSSSKRVPDPELIEEAKRLIADLSPMNGRTIEDKGDTLRFTITVPKEWAILAAWLIFKADMEGDGKPGVLPRPVRLHLEDGQRGRDWTRAKHYFNTVIGETLNEEWLKLQALVHPVLFRDDEAETDQRHASPRLSKPLTQAIEDDLPF